tara:strand:+ start:16340 stop:17245 length:906 start_codon:yes stop_codon:yes gene_type:complete
MKCLVTGGCGFIGGHMVDKLLELGHSVAVVDNFAAESDDFWKNSSESVVYYEDDICDVEKMSKIFEKEKFDWVFHMAAESRIQPALINPVKASHVNVTGTCILLNLSRDHKIKRFVYSSTSACYGSKNKPPLREDMENDNLNPYAVTKLAAEDFCIMYWKTFETPTVALRYFNVYGDRMPSKGQYAPALAIFMKQKKEGMPLSVVGDGLQTRDFIHVSDVVNANITVAESQKENVCGNAFNVGTGKNRTMLEIAEIISKNIIHIPARPGESKDTLCDFSKIEKATGWQPKIDLREWLTKKG